MGQGRNARRARLPLTRIPHSEKLLGVLALTGAPKLFGQSQVEVEPVRRYRTIAAGALGNGSCCVLLERSESSIHMAMLVSDLDVFQGDDGPGADATERVPGRCRPNGGGEESAGDRLEHGGLRERSVRREDSARMTSASSISTQKRRRPD